MIECRITVAFFSVVTLGSNTMGCLVKDSLTHSCASFGKKASEKHIITDS